MASLFQRYNRKLAKTPLFRPRQGCMSVRIGVEQSLVAKRGGIERAILAPDSVDSCCAPPVSHTQFSRLLSEGFQPLQRVMRPQNSERTCALELSVGTK